MEGKRTTRESGWSKIRILLPVEASSGLLRAPGAPNSETKNPLHIRAALFFFGALLKRALDGSKKENPQLPLRVFHLLVTPSGFKPETF